MSDFVFAPSATPSLAIAGTTQRFAVRRIWCVGRNYAAHARELGNDEREPPFFFSKQPDMLVPGGGDIAYPGLTQNLHYEGELVVALKGGGQDVPPEKAAGLIFGYARVTYGLWSDMLLHVLHNGLLISLVVLQKGITG